MFFFIKGNLIDKFICKSVETLSSVICRNDSISDPYFSFRLIWYSFIKIFHVQERSEQFEERNNLSFLLLKIL